MPLLAKSCFTPTLKFITGTGALALAGLLTGCGIGPAAPSTTSLTQLQGLVHGGQNAIQGASIKVYVTNTTATTYGAAATPLGTATTDVNGNFTIAPSTSSANCPTGQQVYITSSGGNPVGQPSLANSSVLLMAALGDCSTVSANTFVIINEVTTVAAAYALSGFMTTTTGLVAQVSAPAANRVSTPDSVDASGLQHAFLNANNLVNYSIGQSLSATPAENIGGTSTSGIVPATEINTLADILQSCVNSATGSTSCTNLFADTPSVTGVAPTNTLQAMINLARNPYPSTAAMTGTNSLFSLVSSSPAFQPTLTATPPDWALVIDWKLSTTPYYLSLDANDTVYYGGSATTNVVALSAYGNSTPAFAGGTTLGSATRQVATDNNANVWVSSNGTSFYQFNTGTGALTNTYTITGGDVYGVAVDKVGNVWIGNAIVGSSSAPSVIEYARQAGTGGSVANYVQNYSGYLPTYEPTALAIDQNQNIWAAPYYTGGTMAAVLPNTSVGGTSAPAYGTVGTPTQMVTATFNGSATKPLGLVFDTTGDAWYGITGSNSTTTTGLEEVIPSSFTAPITSITPQTLIADAVLGAKASQIPGIDGAGTIYLPDNQGAGALGVHAFSSQPNTKTSLNSSQTAAADQAVLSPASGYLGCAIAAGATTCGTGTASAIYNPREVVVDSTGSLWMGISSGGVSQVIGLGAPAYPLMSIGRPSLAPGLTAVQALP